MSVNLITSIAVTRDVKAREISIRLEGFPPSQKQGNGRFLRPSQLSANSYRPSPPTREQYLPRDSNATI